MRNLSPLLFALLVGCLLLAYLGSAHGGTLLAVLAASAGVAAIVALCAQVVRTDSRLAAEEAVGLGLPVGEGFHALERSGRSALLVFVRADRLGRIVEAFAYDPDEDA
ncbi:MAG: hypothetical protein JST31_09215 [Actinobacteria bacterium]|nr:hypothetical protein [Actinomycetota bacterium]